jgi:predicted RNA-binding protein YlqC (UPF0109 family)
MRNLLNYLVTSLVDNPETVNIREQAGEQNIAFMVYLEDEDMPRIIGKGGRVANAVRIIMRAAGGLSDKSIWVDFSRHGAVKTDRRGR